MNVQLSPKSEALVRAKVASGQYLDATDVLDDALHLLEERDRLAYLKAAIAIGEEQHANGEYITWTESTMDKIQREADEADALDLPIGDDIKP